MISVRGRRVAYFVTGLLIVSLLLLCACDPDSEQQISVQATEEKKSTYSETQESNSELVAVIATNGEKGYVYADDLERAESPARNPEEANDMMERRQQGDAEAISIPVYEEDGETIVGEFLVG